MAIGVNIISDFDSKGITKAIEEFKKLETTSERSAFVLKKAFLPAAAVLTGLAVAGFQAAQAAAQDEAEQSKLAQTLNKVVKATSATVASTEKMIGAMSRATGTADTELRESLSKLVVGTGSLEKAQTGLALAQDIATATGMPLASAAQALSLAYNGNFRALQRLSPELKDLVKDGATTDQIFSKLNKTFGGATATAADTTAGKMKILKNNMAELSESLGAALLPALEKMTEIFTVVFGFMSEHTTTVLLLAAAIGTVALAIVTYNIALKIATIMNVAFGATAEAAALAAAPMAAMAAGIMLAVIAVIAIGAALVYAYQNFEGFRNVVNTVVNFVIGYVEFMLNAWIKVINGIISAINILIKGANLLGADIKPIGKIGEVAFGRVGVAAQSTLQQLKNVERQAENTANAIKRITLEKNVGQLNKVDRNQKLENMARIAGAETMKTFFDNQKKGANAAGGAVETAAEKLTKFIEALKGVTSAQTALISATKGVETANEKLGISVSDTAKAQEHFNKVSKGYALDSKEVVAQTDAVNKAQRNLTKANAAVTETQTKFNNVSKGYALTSKEVVEQTGSVERAQRSLTKTNIDVTKAQINFNKVSKGYALTSKEVFEQTRSVSDAQRNLIKANITAADSVDAITKAELALLKLREKVNPFDIESGEIGLQRSKFDVEEANFAVLAAEKELADLRLDPLTTPQAIREAEIALAESRFSVRDAIQSVADAEKELLTLRTNTPTLQEIEDAERAVADAKFAAVDASIAQVDAQTNVNTAQEKLNELVNGAKVGSDIYNEALLLLTEATIAQKDAQINFNEQQEKLNELVNGASEDSEIYKDALNDLNLATFNQIDAQKDFNKNQDILNELVKGASKDSDIYKKALQELTDAEKAEKDAALLRVKAYQDLATATRDLTQAEIDRKNAGVGINKVVKAAAIATELANNTFNVPRFAKGGIVTSPMIGMVGESGAEAIIPLDRMGSFGSTYNISVTAGMGADGKDIGTQIVNALKRYERTNGALPLTVA